MARLSVKLINFELVHAYIHLRVEV